MIIEAKCEKRNCVHYNGVLNDDDAELNERHYCSAFPDGIPVEIAHGDNLHLVPIENQSNNIVFKKEGA